MLRRAILRRVQSAIVPQEDWVNKGKPTPHAALAPVMVLTRAKGLEVRGDPAV